MNEEEIYIGKRSGGKTYNLIKEMEKEINRLQKENVKLKEKLHEKNMQIIKLNKLLGE